jgi:glycine/D-amino acid oxidase-like deaminating enzyme
MMKGSRLTSGGVFFPRFGSRSGSVLGDTKASVRLTGLLGTVLLCVLASCGALRSVVPSPVVAEPSSAVRLPLRCEILIVGGGAGGLHTAFRLGQRGERSVCLFEKTARLGGRIFDVPFDGADGSPRFGVGARRIEPEQEVVLALAEELGVPHETAPYRDDLILARGHRAWSKDQLARLAYPALVHLDDDPNSDSDVEDALYEQLRQRTDLEEFPDFPSYVRATVGSEGYRYLLDVSRFRAEFEYPLDARGYLDWLDEEWTLDTKKAAYPVGGMSELIRRMAHFAEAAGVRIFLSQPVTVLRRHATSGYEAHTPSYQVAARSVVIAVDAAALRSIRGDVVEAIVSSPQYQQLIGVKVVTVTQWWPAAWWTKAYPGKDVRRVWTTNHCLNFMEAPVDRYGAGQLVTRTVYSDQVSCVALWEQLAATSVQAVESQIDRELRDIFPGVEIPRPLKTHIQVWPNGWYWLRAGSPFTNAEIAGWAVEPLPGEAVSLVGESYNPQRSSWSDGALKSSIATLNARFGFNLLGAATATK